MGKPPRAVVRPVASPRHTKEGASGGSSSDVLEVGEATSSSPLNKDSLVDLYRRLDGCVGELRGASVRQNSSSSSNPHAALIRLSDVVQQFQTMCAVYAENISPHSKFRYRSVQCFVGTQCSVTWVAFRELLTRMDSYVHGLRQCAVEDATQQERVLKELEQTFRDVMLLIQR
jgi:hypothetical protein